MVVHQTGHHGLPFQVDQLRPGPGQSAHLASRTGGEKLVALYRKRLLDAVRCIYRDHLAVVENGVRDFPDALRK